MSSYIATIPAQERLIKDWHAWMKKRVASGEMSADTANTYRRGMHRFYQYLAEQGVRSVTWQVVETFKTESLNTHSAGTVGLWLASVRAFYKWATRFGFVATDPTKGITAGKRRGANRAHTREPLTDAEARALLTLDLHPRDSAIIAMMLYCAMRGVAVRRADIKDISTKGSKRILTVQEKGDTDKQEVKVIPRPALLRLNAWLAIRGGHAGPLFESMSRRTKHKRLAASSLRQIVAGAFSKAAVASSGTAAGKSHRLRHTAITTLLKSGGSLRQAQTLAGHADIKTTMIYAHELDRTENAPEEMIDYGEK